MIGKVVQFVILLVFIGACATSKNRKDRIVKKPKQETKAEEPSIFDSPRYELNDPQYEPVPPPRLRHEQEAPNHVWSGYGGEEYVHHTLTTEVIAEVMDANGRDIEGCYQKIVPNLKKPRTSDTFTVQMTILNTGATRDIKLLNASVDNWLRPPLENCLKGKILRWKFPRSQNKQLIIQQQFLLNP
ncbi:MAG: AgmX/PglI C-terminal domain-containing protein [Oligoflexales bacterium]|nr:AgmX/PglI C-terminal domain-containing protein [Oligoflexales bacterium]